MESGLVQQWLLPSWRTCPTRRNVYALREIALAGNRSNVLRQIARVVESGRGIARAAWSETMITYCENPVKLVALLPEGLQPTESEFDSMKRKVWTFNYKTGQLIPVALELLDFDGKWSGGIIADLEIEYDEYRRYMQKNG